MLRHLTPSALLSSRVFFGLALTCWIGWPCQDAWAQPVADLAVVLEAAPTAIPGETVLYQIRAFNYGPNAAREVRFIDHLSNDLDCVWMENGIDRDIPAGIDLAVGDELSYEALCRIDPAARKPVWSAVQILSDQDDPDMANNESMQDTVLVPDLTFTVEIEAPTQSSRRSPIDYSVSIRNVGSSAATNPKLRFIFTNGITFLDATGCELPVDLQLDRLFCNRGTSLEPGSTWDITLTFELSKELSDEQVRVSAEILAGGRAFPEAISSAITDVLNADLQFIGRCADDDEADICQGDAASPMSFRLTLTNSGNDEATNLTVTPTSQEDVTFQDITGCDPPTETLPCVVNKLPVGATRQLILTVMPPAEGGTFTIEVVTGPIPEDPDGVPPVTLQGTTDPVADLHWMFTCDRAASCTKDAGSEVSYTLEVTNSGPSSSMELTATVLLPTVADSLEDTVLVGFGGCDLQPDPTTCQISQLEPHTTRTLTVDVALPRDPVLDELTIEATVASATIDPTPQTENLSVSTTVVAIADLQLSSQCPTSMPCMADSGSTETYWLEIDNIGPSRARDTVLNLTYQPGIEPIELTGCRPNADFTECTFADDLPPDAVPEPLSKGLTPVLLTVRLPTLSGTTSTPRSTRIDATLSSGVQDPTTPNSVPIHIRVNPIDPRGPCVPGSPSSPADVSADFVEPPAMTRGDDTNGSKVSIGFRVASQLDRGAADGDRCITVLLTELNPSPAELAWSDMLEGARDPRASGSGTLPAGGFTLEAGTTRLLDLTATLPPGADKFTFRYDVRSEGISIIEGPKAMTLRPPVPIAPIGGEEPEVIAPRASSPTLGFSAGPRDDGALARDLGKGSAPGEAIGFVAFESRDEDDSDDATGIDGQPIDALGQAVGKRFTIVRPDLEGSGPELAPGCQVGTFFLVWEDEDAGGPRRIRGQRIDPACDESCGDPEVLISPDTSRADHNADHRWPDIAPIVLDSGLVDGYLVAWQRTTSGAVPGTERSVLVRRVGCDGELLGDIHEISEGTPIRRADPRIAVAYDKAGGEAFAVWTVADDERSRIAGRILSTSGEPNGGVLKVDDALPIDFEDPDRSDASQPDITFSRLKDHYFVVWRERGVGAFRGGLFDIPLGRGGRPYRGQRRRPLGTTGAAMWPRVETAGSNFIVTWADEVTGGENKILVQLVPGDGTAPGEPVQVDEATDAPDEDRLPVPALVPSSENLVVVWESDGLEAKQVQSRPLEVVHDLAVVVESPPGPIRNPARPLSFSAQIKNRGSAAVEASLRASVQSSGAHITRIEGCATDSSNRCSLEPNDFDIYRLGVEVDAAASPPIEIELVAEPQENDGAAEDNTLVVRVDFEVDLQLDKPQAVPGRGTVSIDLKARNAGRWALPAGTELRIVSSQITATSWEGCQSYDATICTLDAIAPRGEVPIRLSIEARGTEAPLALELVPPPGFVDPDGSRVTLEELPPIPGTL